MFVAEIVVIENGRLPFPDELRGRGEVSQDNYNDIWCDVIDRYTPQFVCGKKTLTERNEILDDIVHELEQMGIKMVLRYYNDKNNQLTYGIFYKNQSQFRAMIASRIHSHKRCLKMDLN